MDHFERTKRVAANAGKEFMETGAKGADFVATAAQRSIEKLPEWLTACVEVLASASVTIGRIATFQHEDKSGPELTFTQKRILDHNVEEALSALLDGSAEKEPRVFIEREVLNKIKIMVQDLVQNFSKIKSRMSIREDLTHGTNKENFIALEGELRNKVIEKLVDIIIEFRKEIFKYQTDVYSDIERLQLDTEVNTIIHPAALSIDPTPIGIFLLENRFKGLIMNIVKYNITNYAYFHNEEDIRRSIIGRLQDSDIIPGGPNFAKQFPAIDEVVKDRMIDNLVEYIIKYRKEKLGMETARN